MRLLAIAAGLLAACSSSPPVAEYTAGSRVAPFTLEDQFGRAHALDEDVAVVLFARDMDGGGLIKEVLAEHPEALAASRAVYVADISGMPSFVASMSAIPKMRERPYPTVLDRDGRATTAFPARDGQATILRLDALEVTAVRFVGSSAALRRELGLDR